MMSVAQIDLYLARLPLVHEFETSTRRKDHIEHILVRVSDADGGVGWGEVACPSDPYYCEENVETCWLMLTRHLAPALLEVPWDRPGLGHNMVIERLEENLTRMHTTLPETVTRG